MCINLCSMYYLRVRRALASWSDDLLRLVGNRLGKVKTRRNRPLAEAYV